MVLFRDLIKYLLFPLSAPAKRAMAREDWGRAARIWEIIINHLGRIAPDEAFHCLGLCYRRLGKINQASEVLARGFRIYPLVPGILVQQALSEMDIGNWKAAAKKWQIALPIMKDEAPLAAWLNLSKCQSQLGEFDSAQSTLNQAEVFFPGSLELNVKKATLATLRPDLRVALKLWKSVGNQARGTSRDEQSAAWQAKFCASVVERLINLDRYRLDIKKYSLAKGKKRIAVYTAIADGYDTLRLPQKLSPQFDYFVFTDTPTAQTGIWQVRPMPFISVDSTRSARFVKTHPHHLLGEYDTAVWIDANIMITGDIMGHVKSFAKSKKPVAAIPHPLRSSLREELAACIGKAKDEKAGMVSQLEYYESLGFDTNDLIESNFMIFDLNHPKVAPFLNTWWAEIDQRSRRDQLSLNFAMAKNDIMWHRLTKRPNNVRTMPEFSLTPHGFQLETLAKELIDKVKTGDFDPFEGTSFASVRSERINQVASQSIDIVVCVHNALDDVKVCLESISKHLKNPNHKVLVVDDGSEQPTKEFLENFVMGKSWVKLVRNPQGSGYAKAANQGLKLSSADLTILLNSDTIVTSGWAEKMADAVFSSPGAGIVGPLSSAAGAQSIPEHKSSKTQTATNALPKGLTEGDMNRYCETWAVAGLFPRVPLVHGFCFGITKEALKTLGYFDLKNFPHGYGEENDYCMRATDHGVGMVLATNTYIFHEKSRSYPSEKRIELMKQGNQKLRDIYGKDRIVRAILTMQNHPILIDMRKRAGVLYGKK